ncbi:hypothetical protein IX296_003106 [Bacteroides pyogenes]|nr:hypothetical protein [Bacteroides pyogenes]MBR8740095.1 hypothetical protein [Bacteroides pyogenes]MBR8797146.1 hypothetical protein [Bacteroides pyogenes]MBR8810783.1 hypothetical protein [Bacteroides pyogenes]
MYGGEPPELDGSFVQVIAYRLRGFHRRKPFFLGDAVVLLEYLHFSVHGELAAPQANQDTPLGGTDLACGLIAEIAVG